MVDATFLKDSISRLLFSITLVLLFNPLVGQSAVFNVTNEDELRDALNMAESNGEDDTINIATGIYHTGGEPFVFRGGDSLTIEGDGKGLTILDGGGMSRVLDIRSIGSLTFVNINGITIQNGFSYFVDEDFSSQDGAGIYVDSPYTIIEDCEFTGNSTDIENHGAGGGILSFGDGIQIINSIFTNNNAWSGGGAFIGYENNVEIIGNTYMNNMSSFFGGGLSVNGTNLMISNNKFLNNTSGIYGGGLNASGGTITLINNEFLNNNSEASGGGLSADSSNLIVMHNKFTGNSARLDGGGADIASDVKSQISGNIFTGNSVYLLPTESDIGGGALSVFIRDRDVILTNNIFTQNTSTGNGGALDVSYYDDFINQPVLQDLPAPQPHTTQFPPNTPEDNLVLTNNTFTLNNAVLNGGAINVIDSFTDNNTVDIYNNIVYDNLADEDGDDIYIIDGLDDTGIRLNINLFNNDFSDLFITCRNSNGCLPDLNEGNNINEDPLFVDAQAGDVSLQADSACIDAGDPDAPDVPDTDIYGNPRVPPPDMGAVEFIEEAVKGGGGCSIASTPVTSSLAVFLVVPVLLIVRRFVNRYRR